MTTPLKWAIGAIAVLLAFLAFEGHSASAKAKEAAVQAALAGEAHQTADSLAKILTVQLERARSDSAAATRARADAAKARAISDAAVAEAARLRKQFTISSDSGIHIGEDTTTIFVPPIIIVQLKADSLAIARQIETIRQDTVALLKSQQETADERTAKEEAIARGAALVRENLALAKEVKALQPPKCGTVCGAVIGAASVGALVYLAKR